MSENAVFLVILGLLGISIRSFSVGILRERGCISKGVYVCVFVRACMRACVRAFVCVCVFAFRDYELLKSMKFSS